jgi:hypothetical protein
MATVRNGRKLKGAEWQRRGLEYWGVAKKRTCTDETGKAAELLKAVAHCAGIASTGVDTQRISNVTSGWAKVKHSEDRS